MRRPPLFVVAIVLFSESLLGRDRQWQPAAGPLRTRWAADVRPDRVLPEYPRPQLVRSEWQNLNGLWEYAIRPRDEAAPSSFDGKILVPFAVESALSGVMKPVGESNRLWYRRAFDVPAGWRDRRIRLHFGAIDWDATVIVNGTTVGTHRGGYDEATFDVTSALTPSGPQQVIVSVWDPTDTGTQPRGKQVNRPRGIWYTAVTGIWQTVWLEPVRPDAIDTLTFVPDIDAGTLAVTTTPILIDGAPASGDVVVTAVALDGAREVGRARGAFGQQLRVAVPDAKLWTPDTPNLYGLRISVTRGTTTIDEVTSYFGMRKSSLCQDDGGAVRLCLNNRPLFQIGLLDQGWWPDGLYTAPTDAALRYDIEVTKQLGFNVARKHVKVEPARWYYWADTLGLLVWQDMPSTSLRGARAADSAAQFELELKRLVDGRRNHPSIVMWVPFNEGWGQYDTARIAQWLKSYDPSRLVDNASGWTDSGAGDVNDVHRYPGPGSPKPEPARAGVLGEFGGLGLPLEGHTWQSQANWSYRGYTTPAALTDAYINLLDRVHLLIGTPALAAAIYTQTTDVEIEVNGLMTYDRAVIKPDAVRLRAANWKLFTPPPMLRTIVEVSRDAPATWRYVTTRPPDGWVAAGFDDASWSSGAGGFGTRSTPGAAVGTVWNSPEIWLRRHVTLPAAIASMAPQFLVHHDEDVEIYVNGVLALQASGYTTDYELVPMTSDARAALRPGANTIAVHCRQTVGGQFIDVGLVEVVPAKR